MFHGIFSGEGNGDIQHGNEALARACKCGLVILSLGVPGPQKRV